MSFASLGEDAVELISAELDLVSFSHLRGCSQALRSLARPTNVKDTSPPEPRWALPLHALSPNERVARLARPRARDDRDVYPPILQSDLSTLILHGADLDVRFDTGRRNGRTLFLDLLLEELDTLREAAGQDMIYGFHGHALDAAIALLEAGADPNARMGDSAVSEFPPGFHAIHLVPKFCASEWAAGYTPEGEPVYQTEPDRMMAVRMACRLAESLAAHGADIAARYEHVGTACREAWASLHIIGAADNAHARWYRAAGAQALGILSRFCDHSGCHAEFDGEETFPSTPDEEDEDDEEEEDDEDDEDEDEEDDEDEDEDDDDDGEDEEDDASEEMFCESCNVAFPTDEILMHNESGNKLAGWCHECSYHEFVIAKEFEEEVKEGVDDAANA